MGAERRPLDGAARSPPHGEDVLQRRSARAVDAAGSLARWRELSLRPRGLVLARTRRSARARVARGRPRPARARPRASARARARDARPAGSARARATHRRERDVGRQRWRRCTHALGLRRRAARGLRRVLAGGYAARRADHPGRCAGRRASCAARGDGSRSARRRARRRDRDDTARRRAPDPRATELDRGRSRRQRLAAHAPRSADRPGARRDPCRARGAVDARGLPPAGT